jgi:hypothetical protein
VSEELLLSLPQAARIKPKLAAVTAAYRLTRIPGNPP